MFAVRFLLLHNEDKTWLLNFAGIAKTQLRLLRMFVALGDREERLACFKRPVTLRTYENWLDPLHTELEIKVQKKRERVLRATLIVSLERLTR